MGVWKKGSSHNGKTFVVILPKLPFDVRFGVPAGRARAAERYRFGIMKCREIDAELHAAGSADNKTWVDQSRVVLGNRSRGIESGNLWKVVEFEIDLPFIH